MAVDKLLIQACVSSYRAAKRAEYLGCDQVELCDNLAEGGTTSGIGTIKQLVKDLSVPVNVVVRPRGGDFLYSPPELDIIREEIRCCKEAGASCISVGVLTEDFKIDREIMGELVELARPMKVCFNASFNYLDDLFTGIDTLVSLGVDCVLTKGGHGTAADNVHIMKELVSYAGDRILIIMNGGLTPENHRYLARQTGVKMVHGAGILL